MKPRRGVESIALRILILETRHVNAISKPIRPDTARWDVDRLCTSPDYIPDTQHYYTNNAASEVDLQAQAGYGLSLGANCICILSIPHFIFSKLLPWSRSSTVTQTTQQIPLHQHIILKIML